MFLLFSLEPCNREEIKNVNDVKKENQSSAYSEHKQVMSLSSNKILELGF